MSRSRPRVSSPRDRGSSMQGTHQRSRGVGRKDGGRCFRCCSLPWTSTDTDAAVDPGAGETPRGRDIGVLQHGAVLESPFTPGLASGDLPGL
eukprot:1483642-Pyramimonas_sp.AAC.1